MGSAVPGRALLAPGFLIPVNHTPFARSVRMSSDNGSGTVLDLAPVEDPVEDPPDPDETQDAAQAAVPKVRMAPGQLTIRDLKRARTVLEGRNPFELLEDPLEAMTLTVWCVRSRTDPALTWEQAEGACLDDFEQVGDDEPPPPTAAPTPNGSGRGKSTATSSKPRQRSAASTT
jgi:hypothetical protein